MLTLNSKSKFFLESIIIFLTLIINPFISLCLVFFIGILNRKRDWSLMLIVIVSLYLGLLNTTKVLESDLLAYNQMYFDAINYSFFDYISIINREYIYYSFAYLTYYLTNGSWEVFIFLTTFISYYLILKSNLIVLKKIKTKKSVILLSILCIAFFYIIFSHSAHLLRNFIAASLVLFFLVNLFFLNKNYWIVLIVSILIHSSSLVFLIVFFKPNKGGIFYWLKVGFLFLVSCLFLAYDDFSLVLKSYQFERIKKFLSDSYDFSYKDFTYFILFTVFLFTSYFYSKNKIKKQNKSLIKVFNKYSITVFYIVTIALFTLYFNPLISQRMLLFVFVLITIYISLLISNKSKLMNFLRLPILFFLGFSFLKNLISGVWEYKNIEKILGNTLLEFFI